MEASNAYVAGVKVGDGKSSAKSKRSAVLLLRRSPGAMRDGSVYDAICTLLSEPAVPSAAATDVNRKRNGDGVVTPVVTFV